MAADFAPQGCLAVSTDIFHCPSWENAIGTCGVEARDVARHSTMPRTDIGHPNKELSIVKGSETLL